MFFFLEVLPAVWFVWGCVLWEVWVVFLCWWCFWFRFLLVFGLSLIFSWFLVLRKLLVFRCFSLRYRRGCIEGIYLTDL